MPSPLFVNLSKNEVKELKKLRRKWHDYRRERALMILMNNNGKTAPEIAKILNRHPHTVRSQIRNYKDNGIEGLNRDYSPGRPKDLREEAIEKVKEWLQFSPQKYNFPHHQWTKKLLIKRFKQETGKDISDRTMNRVLKDAGFSYKKPKKTVPKNAPSKEEKKRRLAELFEEIKEFADSNDTEIFLVDETHFSTEPYNLRGWFKRGDYFFPQHSQKEEKPNCFWRLESKEKKILLEKCTKRKL